ncbi:putative DD34D transposase [Trichonephila clavipes]|uniref:Putative DD34D transposase n=1 Tax=Trichonephila clavipes TaxID=2585209 RepID=A0A8X6VVY2_TRICX|nr:putative DD34D transposase [Trichonephila clavipes]
MEVNKEKIWFFLNVFFGKGEKASQVAEIVNNVYGANTVTTSYVQSWFHRFSLEVVEVDRLVSNHSIAQRLKIDHKIVVSPFSKVEFKKKLHVWVPHQLTPKCMMDRISISEALAKRNEIDQFLKRMVTEDIYCQQLDRLKPVVDQKCPELANGSVVVFHKDNTRPYPSVVTRKNLWEFGWKVLMFPPYSPDLVLRYYYLFLTFENFLGDKKLG